MCDDVWHMNGDRYFGSGTCHVFTFRPNDKSSAGVELEAYGATMRNEYFMLMSSNCIGYGGVHIVHCCGYRFNE